MIKDNAPKVFPTTINSEQKTNNDENNTSNDHYSFFSEKSIIKILNLMSVPKPPQINNKELHIINPISAKKQQYRVNSMNKSTNKNSYSNRCISTNNSRSKLVIKKSESITKPTNNINTRNERPVTNTVSFNQRSTKKNTIVTSSTSSTHYMLNKLIHNGNHQRIISCTDTTYSSSEFKNIKKPKPHCIVTTISIKDSPPINTIINHNINKIASTCPTSYKHTINTDDKKISKRDQFLSYQQMFRKKISNLKQINTNKLPKPSYTTYMHYKTNCYLYEPCVKMDLTKYHSAQRTRQKESMELQNVNRPTITKRIPHMTSNNGNRSTKYLRMASIQQIIKNQLNDI